MGCYNSCLYDYSSSYNNLRNRVTVRGIQGMKKLWNLDSKDVVILFFGWGSIIFYRYGERIIGVLKYKDSRFPVVEEGCELRKTKNGTPFYAYRAIHAQDRQARLDIFEDGIRYQEMFYPFEP